MSSRSRIRHLRLAGLLLAFGLIAGPLNPVGAAAASPSRHRTPVATPGRGPVAVTLPLSSQPYHGSGPGERPPVIPPSLGGQSPAAGSAPASPARTMPPSAPRDGGGGGGGGGGTGPQATNLHLLPGLVVGDTSLELYYDAPSTGWTQGIVSLYAASDTTTVLHSATFAFAQAQVCGSPAKYCFTLDNKDSWGLVAGTSYVVTVTLMAPDGTLQASDFSPAATPRVLPVPPPVAAEQLRGDPGNASTGPTDTQPKIRGVGVNTATGAFTQHAVDAEMKSAYPIDVQVARTYSSLDTTAGLMGVGWSFSYEARVFARPGAPGLEVFRAEDGTQSTYTLQPDGTYLPPAGALSTLTAQPGGGWRVVTPAQQRLDFDASGREVSFTDERGKGVTLGYDASGNLATVTDAGGRALQVTVQSGLLTALTLPDGRSVHYTYSSSRLATVRDPDGDVTTFAYDGGGRLQKITDALGHLQLTNAYDATSGRVSTQTDHFGHVTTFAWDPAQQLSTVTDADGAVFYDGYMGNVLQFTQAGGPDTSVNTTVYRADAKVNNQVLGDGQGHQYEMAHDGNGNVTSRTVVGATDPASAGASETASYDGASNVTTQTDARGNTTTYAYNQFSQLLAVTDPLVNTTRFAYYPDTGLMQSVTDPVGNVTTYAYDAAGDRISQTNPLGAVSTFSYDKTGRVVSATDPRGNVAGGNPAAFTSKTAYDGEDRARRVDDALGHFQLWSYDNAGRLHTYTDANTFATTYVYNDGNQLVQKLDPDVRTTSYTYTPGGRLASTTDGAGDITKYAYDTAGRLKTVTSPRGTASGADPTQFTTTYTYDVNGNRTSESHPYPGGGTATTQYAYDTLNHLVSVTDPLGRTTTTGYDAGGNRISVTDALGHPQSWTYDADNRVLTATDPLGNTTGNHYDALGRVDRQQTALGEATTFAYDAAGRLVTQTSPRGNATSFAYDAAGNRISVTDPLGDRATATYDANNNVTSRTDPNGHATTYAYDADNRLTTILGPDATAVNQATVDGYDHAGHLITQTNPLGFSTRYTYDAAGRLASSTDQVGRARQYVYDADGNLVSTLTARATTSGDPTTRAANTITQRYDILGRLVERDLGSGPVYTYGYDAAGEVTSLADQSGQQTRTYDAAGHLTGAARGAAAFRYAYDAAGGLTSRALPDGTTQTLTYNADNRPATLTVPAGTATYHYDADGNLTSTLVPGGSQQQRGYDSADRLTSLSDLGPSQQVLSSYTVTRDATGNPTRLDTSQGGASHSDAFAYDAANRVTAMCYGTTTCGGASQKLSFTYDLIGNRLTAQRSGTGAYTQQYQYDAASELSFTSGGPSGTVIYSYDADGNQVQAGGARFSYDLDNALVSVDDGTRKTVYTQDAAGNRLAAATTPDSGGSATQTTYQWDVNSPLAMLVSEQAGAGPARSYTYNPGGSPLSLQVGGGSFLYQPDPFGNTAELTDLGGAVQQQLTLTDPFGGFSQTTPGGSGTPAVRLGFQGQYNDPLSGDYHLHARDYVPGTGRFSSVDPVARPATNPAESTYVYAHDNPLTGSDPSGLGCGWFSVVCDAASKVVSTVSSAASTVVNAVSSAANTVVQAASTVIQTGVDLVQQAATNVVHAYNTVKNAVVNTANTVVHAASDAYHAAATWVDKHKAQIASIAAGIAVGAACEALTAGAGTIGCAALAGAVGSMVSYGMTTPSNQLSLGGFLMAGAIGGLTGALTAGVASFAAGTIADVAGGLLGRVASAAEDAEVSAVGAGAPEGGAQVLLDTNAVIRFNAARALIGEGEQPVVTQTTVDELADVAARRGLSGALPKGIQVIADDTSITGRAAMLQQLRMFGAAQQGIEGDAAVGATGLARGLPLITNDWALGNAFAKLGGEFRYLPK